MSLEHEYTNEIVCPYCGYEESDSWEFGDGEDIGLCDCADCEKSYYATRNISVSYSTNKAKYGDCIICGEEDVVLEKYSSSMGGFTERCLRCGSEEKSRLRKKLFEELEEEKE